MFKKKKVYITKKLKKKKNKTKTKIKQKGMLIKGYCK